MDTAPPVEERGGDHDQDDHNGEEDERLLDYQQPPATRSSFYGTLGLYDDDNGLLDDGTSKKVFGRGVLCLHAHEVSIVRERRLT